jgi:iron-sulfur cluster repair protein YtfE (RIC family)
MSTDSMKEILGGDHRRLDAILADAKRGLAAGDIARAAEHFARFRSGLERHIALEEEIVFPAFEALAGPSAGGPIQVMRREHAEIQRLMAEVSEHLARGGEPGHATPFAPLTALLYAHNGKEERILYPATDEAAQRADALAALVERVRAY